MILGRDVLKSLGIILNHATEMIIWVCNIEHDMGFFFLGSQIYKIQITLGNIDCGLQRGMHMLHRSRGPTVSFDFLTSTSIFQGGGRKFRGTVQA